MVSWGGRLLCCGISVDLMFTLTVTFLDKGTYSEREVWTAIQLEIELMMTQVRAGENKIEMPVLGRACIGPTSVVNGFICH